MDLKKKLKRFFTLTRKANDGFTLVELIIVIAILAILAGAAVPAYNGYTKKAREAADQMIVAAANDAFAAACMENKVDAMNVTEATVSVLEGKVYGLSSAKTATDEKLVDKAAPYFLTYFEGNGEMVFQTPGINSLKWNDLLDTFEMKEDFIDTRIVLSDGSSITVSAEDMKAIMNSAYAEMGYTEVAQTITDLNKCSGTLYNIASTFGMKDRLTNALYSFGITSSTDEANKLNATQVGNGLQLVIAQKLAGMSDAEIKNLANQDLTTDLGFLGTVESSYGLLSGLTSSGGTDTITAVGVQYALAEGFAQTDAGKSETYKGSVKVQTGTSKWGKPIYETYNYECNSTEEFLNSEAAKADPVWAINQVKKTSGYNTYTTTDPQYQKDLDGFVGTMSVIGDNAETTTNPDGAISTQDYLNNGIYSQDAKDALTGVLGQ